MGGAKSHPTQAPEITLNVGKRVHFTRSQKKSALVLHVTFERPPKPIVPTRSQARKLSELLTSWGMRIEKYCQDD